MIRVKIDELNRTIYVEQSKMLAEKKETLELLERFEKALRT